MIRAAITILLYLTLGFATSIAVGWVAGVMYQATDDFTREYLFFGQLERAGRIYEAVAVDRSRRAPIQWWSGDDRWGPFSGWSALNEPPENDGQQMRELAAGWPLLCVHSVQLKQRSVDHPFAWQRRGRIEGRINLPWPNWEWDRVDHIPTSPIWPNLLINAAFWTMFWLVAASLRNLWRFNKSLRRVPKGLCGWCGYDLRKTPAGGTCPECGHAANAPPRLLTMPSWVGALVVLLVMALVIGVSVSAFALVVDDWPLHRAAFDGNVRTLDAQLARGVDIDGVSQFRGARNATPLVLAVRGGQVETTKRLIEAGADINLECSEGLPLVAAVERGDAALVRLLLEAGAIPDWVTAVGEAALATAANRDDLDIATQLLEAGADPNIRAGLPLHRARSVEMVDLLLDHGADIDGIFNIWSPLGTHVQNRRMNIARHLIERGATVDFSAVRSAVIRGRARTLQYLVDHGADLTATDRDGLTAWHFINSGESAPELWELLYLHNPNVNTVTSARLGAMGGQTPLHAAFHNQGGTVSAEYVTFLLDHGADPRIQDANGWSAIDDAYPESTKQLLIDAAERLEQAEADE